MVKFRCIAPKIGGNLKTLCGKTFESTQEWQTAENAVCGDCFKLGFSFSSKNKHVYPKAGTPAEVFMKGKAKLEEPEPEAEEIEEITEFIPASKLQRQTEQTDLKDIILTIVKGCDGLLVHNPSTGVLLLNYHNALRSIKRLCGGKEP